MRYIFFFFFVSIAAFFVFHKNKQEEVIPTVPKYFSFPEAPNRKYSEADKYIYANLTNMTIRLYNNGLYSQYPILAIRNIGSKFDTPTGSFTILTKEPLHFSSIGHVWMPLSMQFDGNFFVHGVPYYSDGERVSTAFSGGCIRLTDDVAKIVYDFATLGMPIIVN